MLSIGKLPPGRPPTTRAPGGQVGDYYRDGARHPANGSAAASPHSGLPAALRVRCVDGPGAPAHPVRALLRRRDRHARSEQQARDLRERSLHGWRDCGAICGPRRAGSWSNQGFLRSPVGSPLAIRHAPDADDGSPVDREAHAGFERAGGTTPRPTGRLVRDLGRQPSFRAEARAGHGVASNAVLTTLRLIGGRRESAASVGSRCRWLSDAARDVAWWMAPGRPGGMAPGRLQVRARTPASPGRKQACTPGAALVADRPRRASRTRPRRRPNSGRKREPGTMALRRTLSSQHCD